LRFRKTWNPKTELAENLILTMNRTDFFKRLFLGGASLIAAKHVSIAETKAVKEIYLNLKARIRNIDPDAHPYRRAKMRVFYDLG